ncbi:MAG: flagellar biosynthetic protein FliR [Rhizobium sp.]|nr:flagellar biosynthetic protein FliR [Rhizobium sp.]
MDALQTFVALFVFALLRYLPVVALPTLSPLGWAPPMVRLVLLLALSWMTVLALPAFEAPPYWRLPMGLVLAGLGELLLGMTFGLALMVPNAALHSMGWLVDMQAGLSASNLLDPGGSGGAESLMGRALMLASVVLFFTLDLHVLLFRFLHASAQWMPLGRLDIRLDPTGFFGLLGGTFLMSVMVVAPVILGLFCMDVGVAYATRSMPQANVFFLALPFKVAAGLGLLALSLWFAAELIGRLYRDALLRLPTVMGAG